MTTDNEVNVAMIADLIIWYIIILVCTINLLVILLTNKEFLSRTSHITVIFEVDKVISEDNILQHTSSSSEEEEGDDPSSSSSYSSISSSSTTPIMSAIEKVRKERLVRIARLIDENRDVLTKTLVASMRVVKDKEGDITQLLIEELRNINSESVTEHDSDELEHTTISNGSNIEIHDDHYFNGAKSPEKKAKGFLSFWSSS